MAGRKKRRIGLILATVHSGSSLKVWPHMADSAEREGDTFFVFPGGRLDCENDSDSIRNSVFSLANKSNLDGLISWSSSIGGSVSSEELERFHSGLDGLPFVTIGTKIKDHPCVSFDAYSGMRQLAEHFVRFHGCAKIAFLRGPESHVSAQERFRAFEDVLRENNLHNEWSRRLVSGCFAWDEGGKAIAQLCEERRLVPGRDFDALIASSDMMALEAYNYLARLGVQIPHEVRLGGFNDSEESSVGELPFTTVHMPRHELGSTAGRMIYQILGGKENVSDVTLPASLVVRESCGCNLGENSGQDGDSHLVLTAAQLSDKIEKLLFQYGLVPFDFIEEIISAYIRNDRTVFLGLLAEVFRFYCAQAKNTKFLVNFIDTFKNSGILSVTDTARIAQRSYMLLMQFEGRMNARIQYDSAQMQLKLNRLKADLMGAHTRQDLAALLAERLPKLGVRTGALVLYKDEACSECIGSFGSGKMNSDCEIFPAENLFPASIAEDYSSGVFIVQPLFVESEPLGYMICGYGHFAGGIYEDLRSSISSSLQSIMMFEKITQAREAAEQAEFSKTQFFANVGNDLCDPLKELEVKIEQLERNLESGEASREILLEQVLFIKSQLEVQRTKTEILVDLTQSQVDDLPMDKRLFDIREALPKTVAVEISGELPLLYGDPSRIEKALSIIAEESGAAFSVSTEFFGVQIYFECGSLNWMQPSLLLAEKIIMLQYGELKKSENSCAIVLPWPNLDCQPQQRTCDAPSRAYSLSSEIGIPSILGIRVEPLTEEAMLRLADENSASDTIFVWSPDSSPIEDWIRIYGMRRNASLYKIPVMCFSKELCGQIFTDAIEKKVSTQKTDPILFVGTNFSRLGTWVTEQNSISIPSMENFEKILTEIIPSLIIFSSVDEAAINRIRQNPKTVLVPILVIPESVDSPEEVEMLCSHPRIILCNKGAAESYQFSVRVKQILSGDEILPPHTGALVKKAVLYLNQNAAMQIVRWKLADFVHVSEDYLTRIFHKELGLSVWEYLNRYRIFLATKMLLETNDTIYEIAENSGFQDQAYFCRVFKKIYGIPPGKIRSKL